MSGRNSSSLLSEGGNGIAGTERTNMSDQMRHLLVGSKSNRHNNTSSEFIIEVLCLEDAATRRGIINRRQQPLEWLDLVRDISTQMEGINVDAWSSSSFNRGNANNTGETGEIFSQGDQRGETEDKQVGMAERKQQTKLEG